ncbi:MAG: TetR/AcrR family transcriptional regulator [Planctomycetota bacterium]
MPRPSRQDERRREVLPILAQAFAELGYRKATTAELARRCDLRENQLYRVWPDKRAMFIAAIDFLFDLAMQRWNQLLDADPGDGTTAAERILAYESHHRGRSGLYRILFAALTETEEPRVRAALRRMYRRFHAFILERVHDHRGLGTTDPQDQATHAAWAIIGVATIGDITRELRLLPEPGRRAMMTDCGLALLNAD